jgi:CRISPR-associated protein Csm3
MKLIEKILINGEIQVISGLRIGGSKTSMEIGGIDLNVIKNASGVPFIPGSSLKGKLRSILAREQGSLDVKDDCDCIKKIFGEAPSKGTKGEVTRLIVRDASLKNADTMKNNQLGFEKLELEYTESKWETAIDRKTGAALGSSLRQMERVPAGAVFDFELIYNVFDNQRDEHLKQILKALCILEDDYLGGCGSRGYGKIKFKSVKLQSKIIENYTNGGDFQPLELRALSVLVERLNDEASNS